MGCLIEFVFEALLELIYVCYIELMSLIVPKYAFTEEKRNRLKGAVKVFSTVLLVVLILGLILLIQADPVIHLVGCYLTWICLAVMAVQILLGIVVKIFVRK